MAGVVVHGPSAWIYGTGDGRIGRHLQAIGFAGEVAGATSEIDPREALTGHDPQRVGCRTVLVAGPNLQRPGFPSGYSVRQLIDGDRDVLARSGARWVLELWPGPVAAPYSLVFEHDGRVVGVGGARTMSSAFLEVAVWLSPQHTGQGLVLAAAATVVEPASAAGLDLTAVVATDYEHALALVRKAGWADVGEEVTVGHGTMRQMLAHRRASGGGRTRPSPLEP